MAGRSRPPFGDGLAERDALRLFPDEPAARGGGGSGVVVYDTGEHAISGVSQANGQLRFTGSAGPIALDTLTRIGAEAPEPKPASLEPGAPQGSGDILGTIERLADLHARGVLTAEEFQAKKASCWRGSDRGGTRAFPWRRAASAH